MGLEWDTVFVVCLCALAVLLNPDARAWAHRAAVTWRFLRNGYSLRTAWYLAEGR